MQHSTSFITAILSILFTYNMAAQCFSEQNFDTPGEHTYIVPGASSESFLIEIEARGGDGGDFIWSGNPQTDGGEGATMGASFIVNGGDELFVIVGESGSDALGSPGGGGGGGGSAVIINGTDVLIAAAAGGGGGQLEVGFGAGASTNSNAAGGSGPGTSGGGGFNEAGMDGIGGTGGGAGTLTSQGLGGTQGVVAGPGGDGFGGGAGGSGTVGGGGGGYQGGDGATGNSGNYGGMGGDSYITTSYSAITLTTTAGSNGGGSNVDGSVTISCIPTGDVEIALVSQSNPLCFGGSSGSIEVVGLGGVSPYTYTIDNGSSQSSGLFENLSAGTYELTVQDGSAATASVIVTIDNPSELSFNVVQVMNALCFGSSDGSIEIEGIGGTTASGFYTYSIDGGPFQGNGLFTGLSAGSHLVVVQDDNGCTLDGDVFVNDQPEIVISITDFTNASCEEATNGMISFSASGGQGGYTYSIDGINFQMSSTFNDLSQGNYTVTVMDTDGCMSTLDFSIDLADPYTFLILDTTDNNCGAADGSVNMLATGGIGGFTYSIDGVSFQMSGAFDALSSGTYTATALDGAGCIQTLEFTIGMSTQLTVEGTVTNPSCEGGMDGLIDLSLDAIGEPYMFAWEGSGVVEDQEDQFNLTAGIYTVTVTDMNGCTESADFEVVAGSVLLVDTSNVQDATCSGGMNGSATLSTSGGAAPYTYTLNGSSNITGEFGGLSVGTYSVDVVDINGCSTIATFSIMESDVTISLTLLDQTQAGCNGMATGSATILSEDGVGMIFYTIGGMTNTTGEFTQLAGGNYIASATDSNGCIAEINVIITENSTLTGSVLNTTDVSCAGGNDGSVSVLGESGQGTYSYALDSLDSQESGNFTNIIAGDHIVTIMDSANCSYILSFTIAEPAPLSFDVDEVTAASCFGMDDGSISFHIDGGTAPYTIMSDGIEFEIADNEVQTLEEVFPGTYDVFISDANGCSIESTVTIDSPSEIVFVEDYLTNVTCFGADDATLGFHIEGGLAPYTLISLEDGSELEVLDNDIVEFTDGMPDTIDFAIVDANGCSIEHTIIVEEPDVLEFVINDLQDASCFGANDAFVSFMIVGGTAPYTLYDDDGEAFIIENSEPIESDGAEPGIYPLTIEDANGCTMDTVVTITEPDLLEITNVEIIDSDDTGNGSISIEVIGGTAPYRYAIGDNEFQTDPSFDGLAEGTYSITVMDANGCSTTVDATILSTDVNDISSEFLVLSVGPNPASQQLQLHLELKEFLDVNIRLLNIQGIAVMETTPTLSLGKQTITLDTKDLQSGVYMINVSSQGGMYTKRIIVQH